MSVKRHLLTFNRIPMVLGIITPFVLEGIGLHTKTSLIVIAPFPVLTLLLIVSSTFIRADCPECGAKCKFHLGGVRYSIRYLCEKCDYNLKLKV